MAHFKKQICQSTEECMIYCGLDSTIECIAFMIDVGGRPERRTKCWLYDCHCAVVPGDGSSNQTERGNDGGSVAEGESAARGRDQGEDDSGEGGLIVDVGISDVCTVQGPYGALKVLNLIEPNSRP